jgi:endoglycosylceramidase
MVTPMGRTGHHHGSRVLPAAIVLCIVIGAAACSDDDPPDNAVHTEDPVDRPTHGDLPRLHAVRGERPGVFDEDGRQVILRAMNLNSLAHYAQNNEDYAPTRPLTGADWDGIAAEGFNTVRLLVSWSWLEPEQGQIDDDYVERIRQAVRDAANRNLYTVIDMHQDAWGPFVATPAGTVCPAGGEPSNGWDGAPEWATPSPSEVDSCRGANGEAKPGSDLVVEAWDRFYRDTDGVQSALVDVWDRLAEALADEPSVAGYDLLNEPGHGRAETAPTGLLAEFEPLGDFYARAIDGIRHGENAAGIDPRPIFFEPTVVGNPPPAAFSDDPGLVYAPHIYGGSIADFISVDAHWSLVTSQAQGYETSLWSGEFGWWGDPDEHPEWLARVKRFAVREDGGPDESPGATPAAYVPVGSAWWQWITGCGDPHAITSAGKEPSGEYAQYRMLTCPDGEDRGVITGWRPTLTRPYPRFAPGWITGLSADGDARTMDLQATDVASTPAQVELWVPGEDEPTVGGTGIAAVGTTRIGLGWVVTAKVCDEEYHVSVGPADGGTEVVVPGSCDGE